jgi:pyruvate dehydrogenase E1 component
VTLYNENYRMPPMPDGAEQGILRGLYRFRSAPSPRAHRVQLLGSGPMLRAALRAQEILAEKYDVAADVWSATSYTLLRREALDCERFNREHPEETPRVPLVTRILREAEGPVIATSDWLKAVPDQIARWVPGRFHSLGTDGFGRSDTREALRRHFRIDAENVVAAALAQLAAVGRIPRRDVARARAELGLESEHGAEAPHAVGQSV